FTKEMREADDQAIKKARVYVDTFDGAVNEAGDIAIPLSTGALSLPAISGDLAALTRGAAEGRRSTQEITLFKSVGTAIEDLAAAAEVYRQMCATAPRP